MGHLGAAGTYLVFPAPTFATTPHTFLIKSNMSEIPQRFTGQAAMSKQDEAAFDLKEWAYAPRAFTEDDVVIKVECCGICGVSLPVLIAA